MPEPAKMLDSHHVYGLDHPLIGVPCLFEGKLAIPYGCFVRTDDGIMPDDDGTRLVILYFDPDSPFEGANVHVKAMAGILPNDEHLVALNPGDHRYRMAYHIILAWLADNRHGIYGRC